MNRLIECVPNFSEGRDLAKIDAIVETMSGVKGAWILDRTSDTDHNRSVITLAGQPEAVAEAVIRGAGKAAELIDMTRQFGAHPRIGATDVIPFVPLEGVSIEECVALARQVGQELWDRYRIPVYFYEFAATRPERIPLENVRKGQFEGLREETLRDPGRSPDIGEPRLHPTAGATAIGVRKLLIAYNIHLNTGDVSIARKIAKAIRDSSGGLRHVKAIGVELKSRGIAQVSINLTDYELTPIHRVFEMVKREAERHGCAIAGSEIIGLVPRKSLEVSAEYYLQLENFSPDKVLENRLAAVVGNSRPWDTEQSPRDSVLRQVVDALRITARQLSDRSASTPQKKSHDIQEALKEDPETVVEAYLAEASEVLQILQRLMQLETVAPSSMLSDVQFVRDLTVTAGRAAMDRARGILPTLHDGSSGVRFRARITEIEAQLVVTLVSKQT